MTHNNLPTLRRTGVALAIGAAMAAPTHAQERLDNIVVTAGGFEQILRDAPASISVVTREELEQRQFSNIAEAIAHIPGVDVRDGVGKTGGLNVSIRGMPSQYTLILIDGRRQNVASDVTPNGFGETGTSFMPPLSAIERIEVIRGPMSTLYGSDAMGGVINVITRRVADEWSGSVTAESTFQQHREEANSQALSFYTSGPVVEDTVGLQLRGRVFNRGESDRLFESTGRDPRPAEGEIYSIGGRLNFTPDEINEFWLDAERSRQWYDNSDSRLGNVDTSENIAGYKDWMRFHRDQVAVGYTGRYDAGTWETSVTHAVTETLGRTIPGPGSEIGQPYVGFPTIVVGDDRILENEQTVLDTKFTTDVGDHMLTFGGQYMEAELTDGIAPDSFDESQWALFIEDEWWLRDDLALTLGGRYENHDAFSGHFTPRGYLVWNADDFWTFKGGVSQGYKTPTLNQLHSGINGVTAQGQTLTIGNPDLQPEKSTNYELGAIYDNLDNFSVGATLFHTEFKDRIVSIEDAVTISEGHPTIPAGTYDQDRNIGRAETQGLELETRYRIAPAWELRAGYTYTDTEIKSDEAHGDRLMLAPKHKLTAAVTWDINDRWSATLEGEHYGSRDRFTSTPEPGSQNAAHAAAVGDTFKSYEIFNLSSTYWLADNVRLTGTIYNLMDKNFGTGTTYEYDGETHAAYDYINSGRSIDGTYMDRRSFWISATYDF